MRMYVCMYIYIYVSSKNVAVYCLTDGHEKALNSLVVKNLFFERRLQSRESLLPRAMTMYSYCNIAD